MQRVLMNWPSRMFALELISTWRIEPSLARSRAGDLISVSPRARRARISSTTA
jgi:hypothetical protein